MDFPISGSHLNPPLLIGVGFVIGILGGFFGVGGSFLAGPALLLMGVKANFTVGTDLAHIVGKSIVAAKRHRALGNVDLKLGGLMVIGTLVGVDLGVGLLNWLKHLGDVERAISVSYLVVLLGIAGFMAWESYTTVRRQQRQPASARSAAAGKDDSPARDHANVFGKLARGIHGWKLGPMVNLPVSGIESISLWVIVAVALVGGFFSGFLGGGAGYIRMPALVYILGVPTHVAVGTDLFEIVVSASYGTFRHARTGNVDFMIALVMHTGAAVGAQIGAIATQYLGGPKMRLAFVPLPVLGAALLLWKLFAGKPG